MNNIIGNIRGSRVNVIINSDTYSKSFATQEQADEFFGLVLNSMKDPSDENVNNILIGLNINVRTSLIDGFDYDPQKDQHYLAGFETPVPLDLITTIENYIEKGYPTDSIINFWTRLMANPDRRVRTDLFKFINTHDFSLTNKGYLVVYKTVDYKEKIDHDLAEFVSETYIRIKTKWKESPTNYVVYREFQTKSETLIGYEEVETGEYDLEGYGSYDEFVEAEGYDPDEFYKLDEYEYEGEVRRFVGYGVTKKHTFNKWLNNNDSEDKDVELVGKLHELQAKIDEIEDQNKSVYTDFHTHTMDIRLGVPVKQERPSCDADPARDCSSGLHVGATKYVKKFREWHSKDKDQAPVLLCLVDPMNVVAVPEYDHSKMRVCEYFPYAKANVYGENRIDIIEQSFFENDYEAIEEAHINQLIKAVKEEELEIRQQAINAHADERSLEEYAKILQARVAEIG